MRALRAGMALLALLPAAGAHAETHVVTIHRMAYELPDKQVHIGDNIEWVNQDSVPHTATSDAGGFDVTLGAGESVRSPVARTGRLDLFCKYHPGMRTVLVVE